MITPNQEKVIKKTMEILGKKQILDKGDILREAGYSDSTARNPQTIYESKGVKKGLEPIVKLMIKKRMMALKAINEKKINESKAKELADIVDTLTKNIELLSGGETERVRITGINYFEPNGNQHQTNHQTAFSQ
ncbi:MAG: hypothetical protein ACOZAL_01035 [Patescibacteria group bacterium]